MSAISATTSSTSALAAFGGSAAGGVVGGLAPRNTSSGGTTTSDSSVFSAASKLSQSQQQDVQQLQQRDRQVRAHEAAHIAASGGLASGANYTYAVGPDGQRYAIGGDVSIVTDFSGPPQQVLHNAQLVERAALAPAEPSAQDLAVAAAAEQVAAQAQTELANTTGSGNSLAAYTASPGTPGANVDTHA